jgi:hypothetical protein
MTQSPVTRAISLVVLAALALGAIGFSIQTHLWERADEQSMLAMRAQLASADIALADLRAAQAAYLSVGQGVEFWMARTNDTLVELNATLTTLQSATLAPDARARYDAALAAMNSVNALDTKARDNIVSRQLFLASDVVFMDGLEANRRVGREIAAARQVEEAANTARTSRLELARMSVEGGALLVALVIAILLSRTPATAVAAETVTLNLAPDQAAWKENKDKPLGADLGLAPGVDLAAAAELCVDLARVLDNRDLPALLGRSADLLGAKGLVLWVVDTTSTELRPSLAYGYADKVIQRMGVLATSADNVTSLAFRTMAPQSIQVSSGGQGAIAVPLVAASGCVGVLSVEMPRGSNGESHSAVARMIAAQLATLVSPLPAAAAPIERSAQG